MTHAVQPGRGGIARLYTRFGPMVAPYRGKLVLAGLSTIGFIVTDLLAPWPIQLVIDGVLVRSEAFGASWLGRRLPASPERLLVVACIAIVAFAGLRGLFSYGQRLLTKTVGHRVVADLRVAVFNRLQRLSLSFHSRRRTGDLLARMTGDVAMLREVLVPAVVEASSSVLLLLGMLTIMALMDPGLMLVVAAVLPAVWLSTLRFGSRIREASRNQRKKEGKIAAVAGEALVSVTAVQAYSREAALGASFSRQNRKSMKEGLKTLRLEESLTRIVDVALALASCVVLWLGARRCLAGTMSPGVLVVFLAYLRGVVKPIQNLVRVSSRVSRAAACGERVMEVLDSQDVVHEAVDAIPVPPLRGEVVFEDVTFGYDPAVPVLHGVSFRIGAYERVGLVGPSGSGKSTILALLLRLHEPQGGRILVDGHDIRGFQLESYRRQIAVVLQEPFLFGVSVEENIRHGRPEATQDEVVEAARRAGAHEFVVGLRDGYDTILGERGASLSRGQQQRLAIARAVLRNAPILVFDEPTTGLDARTERDVVKTLAALDGAPTSIWIAHRLDQILNCSRVLVLRKGRLAEDGVPEALLQRPGDFRRLFGETES